MNNPAETMVSGRFQFAGLDLPWKLLITGFLVILGCGYLVAALNAGLAVGISPAEIADHYGDQSLSVQEKSQIEKQGFVEEAFSLDEEEDMAMGDMPMEHADHEMGTAPAAAPHSLSLQQMAQLAHVHLLGFSLIFMITGTLIALTQLSRTLKIALLILLFLSLGGDIAGLFLVRFVSGTFAIQTMLAGMTIGLCIALTALRVLWELWWPQR